MVKLSNLQPARIRDLTVLLILAALAVGLAALLLGGLPASAGPLAQESPVSPMQAESPVTEPQIETPTAIPAPTATLAPTPTPAPSVENPETPASGEPPVPVGILAAIMGIIGLIALAIGLRRRPTGE